MTFPTATAADEFKLNFYNAIQAQFAADPNYNGTSGESVLVTYGLPGTYAPADIVSFMGVQSNQVDATIGPKRSRDETLSVELVISCVRGGGPEMELVCSQRAYAILRSIIYYARVTDTTIGGSVLWCFLSQHQSDGHTDPQVAEQNRCIEITARFDAKARITS